MKIHKENSGCNKKGWWHFYNNTYEFNLYVYFGDIAEFNRMTGLDQKKTEGKAFAQDEKQAVTLWFPTKRPAPETVAHEALHGVNFVFSWKGVDYDIDNDETAAYLLAWFVKCVNSCKK